LGLGDQPNGVGFLRLGLESGRAAKHDGKRGEELCVHFVLFDIQDSGRA
jgi:hypothetical protein